jgi:hypothetical protein
LIFLAAAAGLCQWHDIAHVLQPTKTFSRAGDRGCIGASKHGCPQAATSGRHGCLDGDYRRAPWRRAASRRGGFPDLRPRAADTRTIYKAISRAKRLDGVTRYGFPESVRRHFERIDVFPRGLLPIGDAICRFNPVYGQGMSVAAQEACVLRRLLESLGRDSNQIAWLASAFFTEVQTLIETPWSVATLDFVFPDTRGQRPADFETTCSAAPRPGS